MRIFYASDTTPNAHFASNLWRSNLYSALVALGHDVVEFQHDLRESFQHVNKTHEKDKIFIEENRPKLSAELLRQVRLAHAQRPIDLFFSYFYDACVLPEVIDEIRGMGVTAVNWFCNGSYQFHLVSEISPHYDWCLVPERFRLKDYEAIGARPIYCQEAANPQIYRPYELPREFDVTFVGQAYGDRPAYIRYLRDYGIDVRVWGYRWDKFTYEARMTESPPRSVLAGRMALKLMTPEGWRAIGNRVKLFMQMDGGQGRAAPFGSNGAVVLPKEILGGVLSDNEMIRMFSRSKINLGFSACGETHRSEEKIMQIRLRDFEVPMSGGFYMVEYMEELEEFFEIGKEIVCYSDPEDLVDKIRYYLIHDNGREKIRKAGLERCQRDHSWHKRFEMAFREMGLV